MVDTDVPVNKYNDRDQFQSCHEVLQWTELKDDEVEGIYFKT